MRWCAQFISATCKHRSVLIAILAAVGPAVFSAQAYAGSTLGGVILNITTNTDEGVIFITTNGTRGGTPPCNTNWTSSTTTWAIALAPANNQVYAQLLTAFATQATVNMWGDGLCNVNSATETLVQLQIGN